MIKKIKNCISNVYKKETPLKIEWIFVGIISLIILMFFLHGDTKNLITWSLNMLDVTFQGRPMDYYKYSIENPNMAPTQYVSGTLYSLMIWAVWNIPIWIAKKIGGVAVLQSPFVWIWGKLFLVACLIVTLAFIYKIVKRMTNNDNTAKWAMFLMASSVFVYMGVFYGGQNDIVICAFAVSAVYCLMNGRMKSFYLLAGMAISVKYFFLIPYIAIILLLEKKIHKIIVKVFWGCLPTLVYYGVTRFCPMVNEAADEGSPISVLLKEMIGESFPVVYTNSMSLFVAALLVVYVLAYLTTPRDEKERDCFIIYYIVAASIAMLIFSTFQYYRVVMLCPFLAILLVIDNVKMRVNVILETIISGALFILLLIQAQLYLFVNWVLQEVLIRDVLHINMREAIKYQSLGSWVSSRISTNMQGIILQIMATIVVVLSIILLALNHPRFHNRITDIPEMKLERWIYWVRGIFVLPPLIYLAYMVLR